VVGEDVTLALGLLLPELQPARTKPTIRAPTKKDVRLLTRTTIGPSSMSDKCHGTLVGADSITATLAQLAIPCRPHQLRCISQWREGR
jgi:hypothetical protein